MAENAPSVQLRLRKLFPTFLTRQRPVAGPLLEAVQTHRWRAFAFGGTPRGVLDEGPHYRPRDLDLVFEDTHFNEFALMFGAQVTRKTRFGGLHLRIQHMEIDAWPLSSTWAFREGFVRDISFQALPQTTFFNADAIAISLTPRTQGRELYEAGFQRAWNDRVLDINLSQNPFPSLCIVRAFRLASSFSFQFAPRLVKYLVETMEAVSDAELSDVQRAHYGMEHLPPSRISKVRRCTMKHWQKTPLLPFQPFPGQLRFPLKIASNREMSRVSGFRNKPVARP